MTVQLTLPTPAGAGAGTPGLYTMSEAEYHADPVDGGSLSSTGARALLPPSCPARFHYDLTHPSRSSSVFDLGKAAHGLVLGEGPHLHEVHANSWRTAAAKAERQAARERGDVPLLSKHMTVVREMAQALRAHPWAPQLFTPGSGTPEQTLIWQERASWIEDVDGEPTGRGGPVACRARVDYLPHPRPGQRMLLPEYKTCAKADPVSAVNAMRTHRYHVQGEWYLRGLRALGLADEHAQFLLVMQEKTPPYLVTVLAPDRDAMRIGEIRCQEAIDLYGQCTSTGVWPGYADDVVVAELPAYETRELEGQVW